MVTMQEGFLQVSKKYYTWLFEMQQVSVIIVLPGIDIMKTSCMEHALSCSQINIMFLN